MSFISLGKGTCIISINLYVRNNFINPTSYIYAFMNVYIEHILDI